MRAGSRMDPLPLRAEWIVSEDLSPLLVRTIPIGVIAWEADPMHPIALARRLASISGPAPLEEITSPLALFADPPLIGRTLSRLLEALGMPHASELHRNGWAQARRAGGKVPHKKSTSEKSSSKKK